MTVAEKEALCTHWDVTPIVVNGKLYGRFCNDCNQLIVEEKVGNEAPPRTEHRWEMDPQLETGG